MDDQLRRMLARKEPPRGFADRVRQAIDERPAAAERLPSSSRWRQSWAALAVAASLAIAVVTVRVRSEQAALRQAEKTERDVEVALRLTSEKLNELQARLTAISARRAATHENQQQQ